MAVPAIAVEHVTKVFKLYSDKAQSAKERIIKLGRMPYEEFAALDDVSFVMPEGTTMGVLGHNGSGKSTLLKCITGTIRPTSGRIRTRGRVAALLELGAGFHPELTGRENVYLNGSILGLDKAYIDKRFDDIVEFSEIGEFIDNQVKHYSSGMYSRLGFAVAVNVDPDVLLVDEVLSVGDEAFQRKCIDRVRQFQQEGRTILVVSHAADLVRRVCDRAVVLDHGKLVAIDEPGPAIRKFRETLMARGIEVAPELDDAGDEPAERVVTRAVRFTAVSIEYPRGGDYAHPDDPVTVRMGYEAPEPVDDVVFAINIHDAEGNLLLGTNTDILGVDIEKVHGRGEVAFELERVPLLDGSYAVSVGIHTHGSGLEYDHREGHDHFQVMNPGGSIGKVHFPINVRMRSTTP